MFTAFHPDLHRLARRVLTQQHAYAAGEWSAERLRRHQQRELRRTVAYTQANSPFYARHLHGYDGAALDPETLTRLPFTTKDHLRDHRFDILSAPVAQTCFFYETTGTTGQATPCPRDYTESIVSNTAVTLCYETILRAGDRQHVVGVAGPTELHSFGDTLGDVCRNLRLPVAKLWPPSPVVGFDKAIAVMQTIGISVLMCTPGMAL